MVTGGNREDLVKETAEDKTLVAWSKLVKKGFQWEDGLIFRQVTDHVFQHANFLVLPSSVRNRVLRMAHEGAGHLGQKKVAAMLRKRFTWPTMTKDVSQHCRSCIDCQRCNRDRCRRAPMVERPVLTEPFENVALDIVGELPKAKGGFRYVLTYICMASKWPEAVV